MEAYAVEYFTKEIEAAKYVADFRDAARFMEACRQCPNYNRSWACPPFEFDIEDVLRQYDKVRIFAAKVAPTCSSLPLSAAQELIKPERIKMEGCLLGLEKEVGGRAFSYIGKCLHCQGSCQRIYGKQCCHPDKVRPSLESFGFDIAKTLSDLFGIELKWGAGGKLPEYLVLVGAVFFRVP